MHWLLYVVMLWCQSYLQNTKYICSYKMTIHSYYPSVCVNMYPLAIHKGRLGEKTSCSLANHKVWCIVVYVLF